jgi:hypothetical protein
VDENATHFTYDVFRGGENKRIMSLFPDPKQFYAAWKFFGDLRLF